MKQKRAAGVAQVDVYYGNAHRSLYDALIHKSEIQPTSGFGARIHPNSASDSITEASYALFLRTGQVSTELLVMNACRTTLVASLYAYNPSLRNEPMAKLEEIALELAEEKDYAKAIQIGDILRNKPGLLS